MRVRVGARVRARVRDEVRNRCSVGLLGNNWLTVEFQLGL